MLASDRLVTLSISAIVPALDEERTIGATLASLLSVADERIVSDGGSRDRTRELARAAGAQVVEGDRGRGLQLNRGAAAASGDVLLFVHADTVVPPGAGKAVRGAIASGALGGAFRVQFDAPGWRYRLGETVASWRSRWSGLAFGDQAQFVRRDVFADLDGFAEWPILEDLDFSLRLRRRGVVAILPIAVTTSARRFARRGPLRTVLRNWWIVARFRSGASPHDLARVYTDVR